MESTREEKMKRTRRKKGKRINILLLLLLFFTTASSILLLVLYLGEKNKTQEAMSQNVLLEKEMKSSDTMTLEEANKKIEEASKQVRDDTSKEYLDQIKTMMENGDGTLTLLETLYPENIVVPDSGRYYFFDILPELKKSDYQGGEFTYPVLNEETRKYEGEASFSKDGEVVSKKGIDVSKFQGDINWNLVAQDGVEFAFIRLGYRGYGSGKIVADEKYEANIDGAMAAGIDSGVYFFTEAINEKEGIEEADFVIDALAGRDIDLPIVIDLEESASKEDSRTKNMTAEERTKVVVAFCERIKEAGYEPMIYGNLKSLMLMLNMEELEDYEKWFAYYHYPLRFPYQCRYWQYSATGKVNGIKGNADLNIAFY